MEEKNNDTKEQEIIEVKSDEKDEETKTSSGLDENVAALLSYVLGFVTGIVFILIEKENKFIRFHALQSIFTFGGLFILNLILTAIPLIGWLIGLLIAPVTIILWILLMVKAYQGSYFKLPIVGNLVEKQLNKDGE